MHLNQGILHQQLKCFVHHTMNIRGQKWVRNIAKSELSDKFRETCSAKVTYTSCTMNNNEIIGQQYCFSVTSLDCSTGHPSPPFRMAPEFPEALVIRIISSVKMSNPIHELKFLLLSRIHQFPPGPAWLPRAWDPPGRPLLPPYFLCFLAITWPSRGRRFSLAYCSRWSLALVPSGRGRWDSAKLLLLRHLWGFWRPLCQRLKARYPTQAHAHIYPSVGHTLVLSSY